MDARGLEEEGGAYVVVGALLSKAREMGVLLGWGEGRIGRVGPGGRVFNRALIASLHGGRGWDEALAVEAERVGATAAVQVFDSFSIHVVLLRGAEPEWGDPCPRCGKPLLSLRSGGSLVPVACPSCGYGVSPEE